MKKLNYKIGALKRKFKLGKGEIEPGDFISKINKKSNIKSLEEPLSKEQVAIMGMV